MNMSTAPYTVVSMVLVVTEVSLLHMWLPRFSRGWLSSSSGIHLFLVILKCTLARLGWCVCFFVFVVLVVSVVLDLVVSVVGVVTIRCSF